MSDEARPAKWIAAPCRCCGAGGVVNPAWLRERRRHARMYQTDIGRAVGKVNQYICDIEAGRRPCPPAILAAYEAL
jgi:hypothetical protein